MWSDEQIKRLSKYCKANHNLLFEFCHEDNWRLFPKCSPKESGYYLTIRVGLTGIYTHVNQWNNDSCKWDAVVLDASSVVAFSANRLDDKINEILKEK